MKRDIYQEKQNAILKKKLIPFSFQCAAMYTTTKFENRIRDSNF